VEPRFVVLACLVALTLGGCGSGERGRDAAAVAERFHAALADGDGGAACDELSAETASTLENQEERPCEEVILTLELPEGATVADTRVYVTSAYAQLAEGGADFLDEGSEGWKVSAAGCEQAAPKQPYDCRLEG
jgi:hypothetical protein